MKVTEWLAVYAAILSTATFSWNFLQSRPRAKTSVMFGIKEGEGVGIYVVIYNRSSHKIHLANVGLMYQFKKETLREKIHYIWRFHRWPSRPGWCNYDLQLFGFSAGCPTTIEPRSSHDVFIPDEKVREILKDAISTKIGACSQDKLAQNSYATPIEYDLPKKNDRAKA